MIRAYVVKFTGTDGRRASVSFDRYGQNPAAFEGRDDTAALNYAVSAALRAVIGKYGPEWINTADPYTVVTVPMRGEPYTA